MLKRALKTPRNLLYRLSPWLFWAPYVRRAKQLGIDGLYILLSFDCDTDEDAKASKNLFEWLSARGIPATFAVPGAQLQSGAKIYRELKNAGAHFLNHGGAAHTELREGVYRSTTFYSKLSPGEVEEDIHQGHSAFEEVLGEAPRGFRAPHFGHFQAPQQLDLIYSTLRALGGYRLSSTTTPGAARRHGPAFDVSGLWEVPIIGSYYWPLRIFDSWGHRRDRESRQVQDTYAWELMRTVQQLTRRAYPAVLNYYADPSHVVENRAYFRALESALNAGAKFTDYEQLLGMIASRQEIS